MSTTQAIAPVQALAPVSQIISTTQPSNQIISTTQALAQNATGRICTVLPRFQIDMYVKGPFAQPGKHVGIPTSPHKNHQASAGGLSHDGTTHVTVAAALRTPKKTVRPPQGRSSRTTDAHKMRSQRRTRARTDHRERLTHR